MRAIAFCFGLMTLLFHAAAFAGAQKILILGDGLSAPYQIPYHTGWVSLLEKKLKTSYSTAEVINSSVVGETSGAGLIRLPLLLRKFQPTIVIIELGSQDGLRGLPLKRTHDNLKQLIQLSLSSRAKVLLIGMQLPNDFSDDYRAALGQIYTDLQQTHSISLLPLTLSDLSLQPGMLLEDGRHPSEKAQAILLERIWEKLQPLIRN